MVVPPILREETRVPGNSADEVSVLASWFCATIIFYDDEFEGRLFSGCFCTVPGNRFPRLSLGPFGQLC
jgi:hypothetical protein